MFSEAVVVAVPAFVTAFPQPTTILLWNVPPFAHSSLPLAVAVAVPVASSVIADVLPPKTVSLKVPPAMVSLFAFAAVVTAAAFVALRVLYPPALSFLNVAEPAAIVTMFPFVSAVLSGTCVPPAICSAKA